MKGWLLLVISMSTNLNVLIAYNDIYIYAFSRRFIQSDLQCIQDIHFLSVYVFPGIEPTTFALLTQRSTTEQQEHKGMCAPNL